MLQFCDLCVGKHFSGFARCFSLDVLDWKKNVKDKGSYFNVEKWTSIIAFFFFFFGAAGISNQHLL